MKERKRRSEREREGVRERKRGRERGREGKGGRRETIQHFVHHTKQFVPINFYTLVH